MVKPPQRLIQYWAPISRVLIGGSLFKHLFSLNGLFSKFSSHPFAFSISRLNSFRFLVQLILAILNRLHNRRGISTSTLVPQRYDNPFHHHITCAICVLAATTSWLEWIILIIIIQQNELISNCQFERLESKLICIVKLKEPWINNINETERIWKLWSSGSRYFYLLHNS